MKIIDAHQHFWRIDRGDYTWMDSTVAAIRRDYLPADLIAVTESVEVVGTISVQAAATEAETRFLLSLAEETTLIKGVVGWVELDSLEAENSLAEFAQNSIFKGIRPMLQDIADTEWLLQPVVLDNLRVLAGMGLTLDALVTPRHLPVLIELAKRVPELSIVVDHCAKPLIAEGIDAGDEWRDGMSQLSRFPQIYCKLSGLANEYGRGWGAETLLPVFQHVLKCFGADRLMWGSDWPVLELQGCYQDWLSTAEEMTASLSILDQQAIYYRTASRFYKI